MKPDQSIRSLRYLCAGVLAAALAVTQPLAAQATSKTTKIRRKSPLAGHWAVFHNATVGECGGIPMSMPAEGPSSVTVHSRKDGNVIVATGPNGAVTMHRAKPYRWKKIIKGDMTILRRVKPKDPYVAMLANVMGEAGQVYFGNVVVSGHTMHYLIGWFKSNPNTIIGHLSMNDQTCHIVRGFEAHR